MISFVTSLWERERETVEVGCVHVYTNQTGGDNMRKEGRRKQKYTRTSRVRGGGGNARIYSALCTTESNFNLKKEGGNKVERKTFAKEGGPRKYKRKGGRGGRRTQVARRPGMQFI